MIYIKLKKDYLKEFFNKEKGLKKLKTIICFWKLYTKGYLLEKLNNGEIFILAKKTIQTEKKLIKDLKMYNVQTVCLSSNLNKDTKFIEKLEKSNIKILNGKWVYKYLILNILEYINLQKEISSNIQEISILSKNITETEFYIIREIANKYKTVNIITEKIGILKKLETELYEEKGIILNITKNYNKSLIKSDVIINVDFIEDELNKYVFSRKAIIINIDKPCKILNKGFDGINILTYKIILPEKYKKDMYEFENEIIYESFKFKKTAPQNIINEILNDKIKIDYLIGTKGEIRKKDYLRTRLSRIKN